MTDQCTFRLDARARTHDCAETLRDRHPDTLSDLSVDAFDDLPTDDEGEWRCPRTAVTNHETGPTDDGGGDPIDDEPNSADEGGRCRLHAADTDDEAILAELRRAVRGDVDPDTLHLADRETSPAVAARRFVGVELETLDLHGFNSPSESTEPLDFRCATIERVSLSNARFTEPVRFTAAELGRVDAEGVQTTRSLELRHASVAHGVSAVGAQVGDRLDCRFATIAGDVTLDRTSAESRFDFGFTAIDGELSAVKADCGGRFTLKEATVAALEATDFDVRGPDPDSSIPGLQFRGLTAAGDVDVSGTHCGGMLIGYKMDVDGNFLAADTRFTEGVTFGNRSGTNLPEARFGGFVSFEGTDIDGGLTMRGREGFETDPAVGGPVRFRDAHVDELRIAPALTHETGRVVDCRNATIERGVLGQPRGSPPAYYDLTETTLGSVRLAWDDGVIPDRVWFDRTTFDGFRFEEQERADFSERDWSLVDLPDEMATALAQARVFEDATGYAADLRTILAVQPATRGWVQETTTVTTEALATELFADVSESTVERVAKNGPENPAQLGQALLERERYRPGVTTFLARERQGVAHPLESVVEPVSAAIRSLAAAIETATSGEESDQTTAIERDDDVQECERRLRDELVAVLASLVDVRPPTRHKEFTYINARKGADDIGDSRAAGQFFVNEQRVRRQLHAERGAYHHAAANWLFGLIAGYGERPQRAFFASIGTVVLFFGVYRGIWTLAPGLVPPSYEGTLGAFLLSLSSFTAFVLDGADVAPLGLRILADVEAFLGAFLLALFVFTLTRSLHR